MAACMRHLKPDSDARVTLHNRPRNRVLQQSFNKIVATCGLKIPAMQTAVLTQNLRRVTAGRLAPKLPLRQLGLRIQAFAIVQQNGRKFVAEASTRMSDHGEIKAVATPGMGVYFDVTPVLAGLSLVIVRVRRSSTMGSARRLAWGLKYSRVPVGRLSGAISY